MQIIQDHRDYNVVFIHSSLDDAGLSPYAFRIYCHIARRANRSNSAWPGLGSIARVCGLSESTARRALKELEDREMLIIQRCMGGNSTNIYSLTSEKCWKPLSDRHPCPTDTPPLSVGHPKVIHEGNPSFLELLNSSSERVPIPTFPEHSREGLILESASTVNKPKRGRPPKPTDPRHQEAIAMFFEMYQERFSTKYGVTAADGKNLKTFLQTFPEVTVLEMRETLSAIWSYEVGKGQFVNNTFRIHTLKDLVIRWNQIVGLLKSV